MFEGFLKRLRGVVGTGILWGAVWAVANLVYLGVIAVVAGIGFPPWRAFLLFFTGGAAAGFISGTIFSISLGIAFRHRTLEEIRPLRFGMLGAAAGTLLPIIGAIGGSLPFSAPILVWNVLFGTALGAATSLASLRMAKSAPGSLESATRVTEIGDAG